MKYFYLKYFLYLCIATNFIAGNSNEIFLQPKARESSSRNKVISREPRAFMFEDMKCICVEIEGVFYESMKCAGKAIKLSPPAVKRRCLSNKFPNYQIVPFRITYTEKECNECGEVKLLKEFYVNKESKDNLSLKCKECCKAYGAGRHKDNPEYAKEYRSRPEVKARVNKRERERRKTDIAFKINAAMSNAVNKSLKGMKNGVRLKDLVDWTIEELIAHLESLFTEGMNWDNYGQGKYKWNLDHIKAVSKFNITSNTCQEFKDCWALKNLQPLWQVRNFEKGNRLMHPKYLIKPF